MNVHLDFTVIQPVIALIAGLLTMNTADVRAAVAEFRCRHLPYSSRCHRASGHTCCADHVPNPGRSLL